MDVITISYTAGFVLYTLLTFGWLIHVLLNQREATKTHWLITLIPFSMWLVYLLGMANYYSGGSITDLSSGFFLVTSILGVVSQTTMFFVLGLMASGYCLLPNGMMPGRSGLIFGLAAAQLILGALQAAFSTGAGKYLSFVLFCILVAQLVYLQKWAKETYAIVTQNPNANLLIGTWACSYPQRAHVAQSTKRIMLTYILITIALAVAAMVFVILVVIWVANEISNDNLSPNAFDMPSFVAWTVGILIGSMVINAFFFLFIAAVWRLGTTERYALLPQHATAPVYGATGGDYAPVYGTPAYGTMPPAYGTVQTAPGYAPTAY